MGRAGVNKNIVCDTAETGLSEEEDLFTTVVVDIESLCSHCDSKCRDEGSVVKETKHYERRLIVDVRVKMR